MRWGDGVFTWCCNFATFKRLHSNTWTLLHCTPLHFTPRFLLLLLHNSRTITCTPQLALQTFTTFTTCTAPMAFSKVTRVAACKAVHDAEADRHGDGVQSGAACWSPVVRTRGSFLGLGGGRQSHRGRLFLLFAIGGVKQQWKQRIHVLDYAMVLNSQVTGSVVFHGVRHGDRDMT